MWQGGSGSCLTWAALSVDVVLLYRPRGSWVAGYSGDFDRQLPMTPQQG